MTNVFRKQYRKLTDQEIATLDKLKDKAQEVYDIISEATRTQEQKTSEMPSVNAREMALAKTKLEESVMWAVKGITG